MSIHPSVNLPSQAHFIYSYQSAKVYCKFRYEQEIALDAFKKPRDIELSDLAQLVREEGISKRNVDSHRVIYEKSQTATDVCQSKPISIEEKANAIFYSMLNSFADSNNFSKFTKHNYVQAESQITNYYVRYFEINEEIKKFKDSQREKLNILTKRITENGVPKVLLVYTYKRMKADLYAHRSEGNVIEAIDYYDNVYTTIREELISEVLNVQP